jgi:ring-1,2-phenylacetyl-CoA epoxidase subunit PaaD
VVRAPVADERLDRAWAALTEVPDPEIPVISVVDLGVVRDLRFEERPEGGERLVVEMLPTFVGCPAIEVMRQGIGERLRELALADEVRVDLTFVEPWTSDRISPQGRERLRRSGFAPPRIGGEVRGPTVMHDDLLTMLPIATCPYCGSRNTTLENPFGPTLCRAIYHCADCRQPFEQFKTI